MMVAYYNENDKKTVAWLRELIKRGHIADGIVDDRSIKDVDANDLRNFDQCHFFAGIGGWSYSLKLAGWSDTRPVWTGSCPCQPFSQAGNRQGVDDPRHLWPDFVRLIGECRPATVFGEQVASKDGRTWLNGIRLDLEALGYAIGAADLCVASINAAHIRQRLWWVANADIHGSQPRLNKISSNEKREQEISSTVSARGPSDSRIWFTGSEATGDSGTRYRLGPQPGITPLADGVSNRVVKLRGYGNAINPQIAAEFIGACMDISA